MLEARLPCLKWNIRKCLFKDIPHEGGEKMIPKYEEILLPFLKYLKDGKEHGLSETHDALAEQ